ncbi:3-oxoacid CoA-transferase subunit B [Steroidobacter cummioxidans]|uniref:3-oxoacid CoA-transferase subunit B n=1 Tax=Steroidobacter cummioxidans TaxID=1803913 RepID=UPI000E319740|nr:3-oxoacid CoA-transferase subunit B [Steroidobacter cummioxidans]
MSEIISKGVGWSRREIARNIALDIPDGSIVNLGIGMPELVASFIPSDREVLFHTENGLLGMGPPPAAGAEDPELINAGKQPVTAIPGASYFHHADSFAMVRGGHIDICVLGAMQVSQRGDLANWSMGEDDAAPAVGGAMDLVSGVKTIFIAMTHCASNGAPKIVEKCTYPLTGAGVVRRIYTDLAILEVREGALDVVAMAPGVDFETLQHHTQASLVKPRVSRTA